MLLTDETINLFGRGSREAPFEEHLQTLYEPGEIPRIRALLDAAVTRGGPFSYEATYKGRDGSVGWLRSLEEPVFEDGVCVAFRGAVVDITDEKGGSPVRPPSRSGFGSRLLQRGVAAELSGRVVLDFADAGLVCTISAPLSARLQMLRQEPA